MAKVLTIKFAVAGVIKGSIDDDWENADTEAIRTEFMHSMSKMFAEEFGNDSFADLSYQIEVVCDPEVTDG